MLEVFYFYFFIYALLEVNLETDKTIRSPNEEQTYLLTFWAPENGDGIGLKRNKGDHRGKCWAMISVCTALMPEPSPYYELLSASPSNEPPPVTTNPPYPPPTTTNPTKPTTNSSNHHILQQPSQTQQNPPHKFHKNTSRPPPATTNPMRDQPKTHRSGERST